MNGFDNDYVVLLNTLRNLVVNAPKFTILAPVSDAQHLAMLQKLNLTKEDHRKSSFCGQWCQMDELHLQLSREGFFYLGNGDRIQCFSCGWTIENWISSTNPIVAHRQAEPLCAMALGWDTKNVPCEKHEIALVDVLTICNPFLLPSGSIPRDNSGSGHVKNREHLTCLSERNPSMHGFAVKATVESQNRAKESSILRIADEQQGSRRQTSRIVKTSLLTKPSYREDTEKSKVSEHQMLQNRRKSLFQESSTSAAVSLRDTLRKAQDERKCKVCFDGEANMLFIPCGHICCCIGCARALKLCPTCRKTIKEVVPAYAS